MAPHNPLIVLFVLFDLIVAVPVTHFFGSSLSIFFNEEDHVFS